jgi:hypothetical protein
MRDILIADSRPLAPDQITIHFAGLTKIDAVRVNEVHMAPEYEPSAERYHPVPVFSHDWAILVLDRHPHGCGFYGVVRDIESIPQGWASPARIFSSPDIPAT